MKLFRRSHLILAALTLGACERANKPPSSRFGGADRRLRRLTRATVARHRSKLGSERRPGVAGCGRRADASLRADSRQRKCVGAGSRPFRIRRPSRCSAETERCRPPSCLTSPTPAPASWLCSARRRRRGRGMSASLAESWRPSRWIRSSRCRTTILRRSRSERLAWRRRFQTISAGRFTGLPFVVRSVWRFNIPGVGRSSPRRSCGRSIRRRRRFRSARFSSPNARRPTRTFSTAYSERSYGDEETVESREVLAAVLLGGSRNAALVSVARLWRRNRVRTHRARRRRAMARALDERAASLLSRVSARRRFAPAPPARALGRQHPRARRA